MPKEAKKPLLSRELMEQLMFGTERVRRFTQDSPVLPDVWLEYTKVREDDKSGLTPPVASEEKFPLKSFC